MTSINRLNQAGEVEDSDIIPIWDISNSSTRGVLASTIKQYIGDKFVKSGTYDQGSSTLTLTLSDGSIVSISVPVYVDAGLPQSMIFSGATEGDASSARDAYFAANPSKLKVGVMTGILVGSSTPAILERWNGAAWVGDTVSVNGLMTKSLLTAGGLSAQYNPATEETTIETIGTHSIGNYFVGIYEDLQALQDAVKTPGNNYQAIVISPSEKYYHGAGDGAVDLGTFTGSTIADESSIKEALQALETKAEADALIYSANKAEVTGFTNTAGTWTTLTHNLSEDRLSSVSFFDQSNNYQNLNSAVLWRPKSGNANAIEVYHSQAKTMTVVCRA